jgi:hypothetical protein
MNMQFSSRLNSLNERTRCGTIQQPSAAGQFCRAFVLVCRTRRTMNVRRFPAVVVAAALSLSALGCTVRARRPDGPYREAQEFADALSDEAVACTREHAPAGKGHVVIAAEVTRAGEAPIIHDLGSSPGSDAVIACTQERATEKLRTPRTSPAAFVRIRVPLPLVTSEVTYVFVQELPHSEPAP